MNIPINLRSEKWTFKINLEVKNGFFLILIKFINNKLPFFRLIKFRSEKQTC